MLSPDEILRISEGAEDIAEALHQDILNRVIDRIMIRIGRKENYRLTAIDKWQLETLKDAGFLMEDIQAEIAKRTGMQRKEIKEAFEDAGVRSARYDDAVYEAAGLSPTPLLESPQYIRMLQRGYNATNGEWTNFTRTLAGEAQQIFIRECDNAYQLVSSGTMSYTQAVREAINRLADEGVKVHYPSGRTDTIETATMRAVRTGISMACAEVTLARMEEMDWDIILVSAHLGARYTDKNDYTNHMWWQGKFYSRTGKDKRFPPFSVCGFGRVQGISGANCRHSCGAGDGEFNPYDKIDDEENKRAYDLSQEQRGYERNIRETKRKTMAIKEGRDAAEDKSIKDALDLDYQKSAAKLQAQNKAYKEFCEKNGLKTRAERTQIAKWDREQAAQARGAAARYQSTKSQTENGGKKGGIVNKNGDTEAVEVKVEQNDIYGLYQPNSQYRDDSGKFDILKANEDYEKFLTTVPESCRMELETAYRTAEFEENSDPMVVFRYVKNKDGEKILYNPRHPNFDQYSYPQALTHELGHRVDAWDFRSHENQYFVDAIEDAYETALSHAEILESYSFDKDEDGFVSDIISAVSKGKIVTRTGRPEGYWENTWSQAREMFANLFSLSVFGQDKHIDFLKEWFPEIVKAYQDMRRV